MRGEPRDADRRNVMAAANDAIEAGCEVLVFSRDQDRDDQRRAAIEAGIEAAAEVFPEVEVVGATAIENLEAWILAMRGVSGSEGVRHPERDLASKHGIDAKNTPAYVQVVEDADLSKLPRDAASLLLWIDRARRAMRALCG